MGAIKGAKADEKFKEIDDDFEIDPHIGSKKSGPKGFGGRDNLRQGVSSGFNFKELLNSGDHCSEDDDLNSRVSNPLDQEEPELVAASDLKKLWQGGYGREDVVENVERLVDRLIMREAEILISQNKSRVSAKAHVSEIDGLDEIEDFEDLDDQGGFHFYGGGAQNKAGPVAAPKRPSMGGLDLNSVQPLNNRAGGFQKAAGASYGKKIGFDDDLEEIEQLNEQPLPPQNETESDWDDDYGL